MALVSKQEIINTIGTMETIDDDTKTILLENIADSWSDSVVSQNDYDEIKTQNEELTRQLEESKQKYINRFLGKDGNNDISQSNDNREKLSEKFVDVSDI